MAKTKSIKTVFKSVRKRSYGNNYRARRGNFCLIKSNRRCRLDKITIDFWINVKSC